MSVLIKVKTPKKPVKGDVNWLTREKGDRPRDAIDKRKFDRGYDQIKWKSKGGKT